MAKYDAFNPRGSLTPLVAAVAASAPSPIQLAVPASTDSAAGIIPYMAVEVTNTVNVADAFLVHASTRAAAAAIALLGIPAAGSAQAGIIHIPAGTDKVYSLRSDEFYTAICASGTVTLYLLPGDGL